MTIALEPNDTRSAGFSRNAARIAAERGVPVLDVVVPVYNEQAALADSVRRLHRHLAEQFPFTFRITIADNASADATPAIAARLAGEFDEVRVRRLEEKGRGRALHAVWEHSDAQVLAYMDVDLSTDLAALLPLVAPLISGHSDVAIGTRLSRGSRVVRGPKREIISRCYNLILRSTLAQFQADVAAGRIHYFVGGMMMRPRGGQAAGSDAAQQIADWVQDNFVAQTVGSGSDAVTIYDVSE